MASKDQLILAKGVRDWYGPQAILRNEVRETLRTLFELFGFNPLETPIIERKDVLGHKGGGEIQKEVFSLKDQGRRELALRFDQTVPLARFYANNHELKTPFKRYAIGEVFRDGPCQPDQGRYRTFTQCDMDIIGVGSTAAEAEMLSLTALAFERLGLGGLTAKINNRKLLDGLLEEIQIPKELWMQVILILDKYDKFGEGLVKKELCELQDGTFDQAIAEKLLSHVLIQGNNQERIEYFNQLLTSEEGKQGIAEIKELLTFCEDMGFDFVEFDPSLARGLDYYTGTTLEVFLKDRSVMKSAIMAGGRYDQMMGDFRGAKEPIPAVGFSFGLERLCSVIESIREELKQTNTELFIIPMKNLTKCLEIAFELRKQGIKCDVDLNARKMKGAMRYADGSNFPFVAIAGEDEVSRGVLSIKYLKDGTQTEVPLDKVADHIHHHLHHHHQA